MPFSYNGMVVLSENDLKHYGVLGMKWGIRRYQNKDGTLTAAGKKHYTKEFQEREAKQRKATGHSYESYVANHANVHALKSQLNDSELRNSNEYKRYAKALSEYENYEMEYLKAAREGKNIDPYGRKYDTLRAKYEQADANYDKKIGEVYLTNSDRLLTAKLKDLKFPDSLNNENMRELYSEYYSEKYPWDKSLRFLK